MVYQGLLPPVTRPGERKGSSRTWRFELKDVLALAKAKERKVSATLALHTAERALAMAEATRRTVLQLCTFLGINNPELPTDDDSVIELFIEVRRLSKVPMLAFTEKDVLYWARTFIAMTERYLVLAEDLTAEPTLWQLYLGFAQKIMEQAPVERFTFEKTLEAAYGYLEAGRRHLQATAFFFVRNRRGHDVASRLFPDGRQNLDEAVIGLLFPH